MSVSSILVVGKRTLILLNALVSQEFQYTGSVLFGVLASFCRLANETIGDSISSFYSIHVSWTLVNRQQFDEEIRPTIDLYVPTGSSAFALSG